MKLNLQRESLLKPLQATIGVVERKQAMPILSNILLSVNGQDMAITGTDLEVELVGRSKMAVSTEFAQITLPGRKLMDICKALPEGASMELYEDKTQVIIRSGKSRFTLSSLPSEDFPIFSEQDPLVSFTLTQADLRQLLQRTHFAMAQQDVRYYLNGMLFEVNPDSLVLVTTDGHRLATGTLHTKIATDQRVQVIVPRKGILELMRLLEETDEPVIITISARQIRIASKEYQFTSKLIEGRFPDYDRVIPKINDKKISIDRELLKKTLSRAAILCNEKFRGLRFDLKTGSLTILANNPEQEVAEEELLVVYEGEPLALGFNVNYLIDVLSTLSADQVVLQLHDSNSSLLIEEAAGCGQFAFVIMPMRL